MSNVIKVLVFCRAADVLPESDLLLGENVLQEGSLAQSPPAEHALLDELICTRMSCLREDHLQRKLVLFNLQKGKKMTY